MSFLSNYIAIFLDQNSKGALGKLRSFVPKDWVWYGDHMTIKFSYDPMYSEDFPEPYGELARSRKQVALVATHIGLSNQAIAVKVEGYPLEGKLAHVTLATPQGGSPKNSNLITNWKKIKSFTMHGTIMGNGDAGEVLGEIDLTSDTVIPMGDRWNDQLDGGDYTTSALYPSTGHVKYSGSMSESIVKSLTKKLLEEDFKSQQANYIKQGFDQNIVNQYVTYFKEIKNKNLRELYSQNVHISVPVNQRNNIDAYKDFRELEQVVDYVRGQRSTATNIDTDPEENAEISGKLIYNQNGIEVFYADSAKACIQYKGKIPYGWCIARNDASNMYNSYRYAGNEPAFYFVKNIERTNAELAKWKGGTFQDKYHIFVVQAQYNGYVVTSANNDGDKEMKWDDIVKLEPKLNGLQELFKAVPLTDTEKNNYERFKKDIPDSEFAALSYEEKKAFLEIYPNTQNNGISDYKFSVLPDDLKNKYIGLGLGLSDAKFNTIRGNDKLIKYFAHMARIKADQIMNHEAWGVRINPNELEFLSSNEIIFFMGFERKHLENDKLFSLLNDQDKEKILEKLIINQDTRSNTYDQEQRLLARRWNAVPFENRKNVLYKIMDFFDKQNEQFFDRGALSEQNNFYLQIFSMFSDKEKPSIIIELDNKFRIDSQRLIDLLYDSLSPSLQQSLKPYFLNNSTNVPRILFSTLTEPEKFTYYMNMLKFPKLRLFLSVDGLHNLTPEHQKIYVSALLNKFRDQLSSKYVEALDNFLNKVQQVNENILKEELEYKYSPDLTTRHFCWITPDNKFIKVGSHFDLFDPLYKIDVKRMEKDTNGYLAELYKRAFNDGYIRLSYAFLSGGPHLSLEGNDKERIKNILLRIYYPFMAKYPAPQFFIDIPNRGSYHFRFPYDKPKWFIFANGNSVTEDIVKKLALKEIVSTFPYNVGSAQATYDSWTDRAGDENLREIEHTDIAKLPFVTEIEKAGGRVYQVGGAVRDTFLNTVSKDLDIMVAGLDAQVVINILSKFGNIAKNEKNDTGFVGGSFAVIKFKPFGDKEDIDVALARTEKKVGQGYGGFEVTANPSITLNQDLERRDFTINAIAKDIHGQIYDPFNGREDLKNKIIRMVSPKAFAEDPLRMLRAVQFAARFGFTIEPNTWNMIRQNAEDIKHIKDERFVIEFDKIVHKTDIKQSAELLVSSGLYRAIFGDDFRGTYEQFPKVKTLAEFIFLLTKDSKESPSSFYVQRFGNWGNLSKIITAFELTRKEINTPAEERWLMNAVNKIDPKAVGSFVVQDKLKDASMHPEEKYPRKAADLAVTGGEIDAMGITGGQHGQLNTDLLNLIYGDKLENTRDAVMGYIQQNFDKYKSTPQKIREIAVKILKENSNNIPDVYEFQDRHAEKIIHTSWNGAGGNQWRYRFENAGDILRELGKYHNQFLDGNYIFEKINKIESFINAFGNENRLHYDDKYSTLKILNADNLKALRHAYEIQPVVTEAQKVALQLIFNLIDGKLSEAKQQIEYFDQFRDDDGEVKLKMANRYPNQITNTPQKIQELTAKILREDFLGVVNYINNGDDIETIEAFKNPKSIRNLIQNIRGFIDAKTGDLYVINGTGYFHNEIIQWVNNKLNMRFPTDYGLIYKSPDVLIPVQRAGNTDAFKLGELYPNNFDTDINGRREMLAKIKNGLTLARQKNPSIEFIHQRIPDPVYKNRESLNEAEGNLDGNFEALVQQVKQRVPSLAKYNEFPEENYDHFQLSKRIGKADVYWHNQQVTLTNVAIMSEFKMSYRNFNEKKWYNFTLKNQIFFDIPDTFGSDMERFVMQTAFNMLNDKYSYHKELMVPETSTYQQADIDAIINEINRKTFEFEDHVNNFTRTEIFEQKLHEAPQQQFKDYDILKVEKAILAEYGETNVTQCGYISPSGYCINIRGAGGNDHRNIMGTIENLPIDWGLYNGKAYENSFSKWLYIALDMGFIRVIPESGNIEMRSMPTQDQFTQLRRFFQQKRGESLIDVYGDEQTYLRFEEDTPTDMIIEAIKRFFLYGEKPEQYDDSEYWNESKKNYTKNIVENITKTILEVRHENYKNYDVKSMEPINDDETLIVYHGFSRHSTTDAKLAITFGLSGQENVSRIYSYENVNNPKGLFVSIDFNIVKKEFAGSGIIIEFATKVSNLEAPVWAGGGSYFVQGDYTSGFSNDEEREAQRIQNRGRYQASPYPAISQSQRPELGQTLFQNAEKQALFIGNLNPNMIRAVWVNEALLLNDRWGGQWVRMSRKDFLQKYTKDLVRKGDKYYDKINKLFQPNDDLNMDRLKSELEKRQWSVDQFIEYIVKNNDEYALQQYFYPKQIAQIKQMFKLQAEEKKTKFTKQQLQEAIMEAQRSQLKRLVLFDMDSTLINSPMPEFGREEYKQKTGGDFPSEKAWWSVPESLDTNVFEITAIAPVFNQMRDEQRRSDTMVVVMTNRLDTLERQVKRVLRLNRINPDALNMASYAMQNKGERILQILKENPSIRYVAFYDDQEKNITDVRNALRKKGITYDLYNCQDGKIRRT